MTQTIEFSVVGGDTIGTATLTDGALKYSNDAVRQIMAGTVARVGAPRAFQRFSDWSNGYVVAKAT